MDKKYIIKLEKLLILKISRMRKILFKLQQLSLLKHLIKHLFNIKIKYKP